MPFFLLLIPVAKVAGGIALRFAARAAIRRAAPVAARYAVQGMKVARTVIMKTRPAAIAGDTYAGANIAGQLLEHGEVQDWEAVVADWTFGFGAYYLTMGAFPKGTMGQILGRGVSASQRLSAAQIAGIGALRVAGVQTVVGVGRSEVFGSPCGATIGSAAGQTPLIATRKAVIGATLGLTTRWGALLDAGLGAAQEPVARFLTGTNPGNDQDGTCSCSAQALRLFGGSERAQQQFADELLPMSP
jgi:hypothetical protein